MAKRVTPMIPSPVPGPIPAIPVVPDAPGTSRWLGFLGGVGLGGVRLARVRLGGRLLLAACSGLPGAWRGRGPFLCKRRRHSYEQGQGGNHQERLPHGFRPFILLAGTHP